MNILQVNKFFYIRGGAARYFLEISRLLNRHGNKVAYFSTRDREKKDRLRSVWSGYFVDYVSFNRLTLAKLPLMFSRYLFSAGCNRKINVLLDRFKIRVAHFHNYYHQFPISVIWQCRRKGIPVVVTVHDYHPIAVNNNMFHGGKICEITAKNKFYKGIYHRCFKDSYAHSAIEVTEKYFDLVTQWQRKLIDVLIAPSRFMRKKLIEYGVPEARIRHLPNFVDSSNYRPQFSDDGYVLYFGRLSAEKGLQFLIRTLAERPEIRLKIAGTGDQEKILRETAKNYKANVEFLGHLEGNSLKKVIGGSRFTVLPSLWFEVAPMAILESFASGKAVVASDIGGIPEMVTEGNNGLLIKPGNKADLLRCVDRLWNDGPLRKKLGFQARKTAEKKFNPDDHYRKLMKIYEEVI